MVILCGWCGKATANEDRCTSCGHPEPVKPYTQRGLDAPVVDARKAGRPVVDAAEAARRLSVADTDEAIAAHHGVDPRTVRHWREKVSR